MYILVVFLGARCADFWCIIGGPGVQIPDVFLGAMRVGSSRISGVMCVDFSRISGATCVDSSRIFGVMCADSSRSEDKAGKVQEFSGILGPKRKKNWWGGR